MSSKTHSSASQKSKSHFLKSRSNETTAIQQVAEDNCLNEDSEVMIQANKAFETSVCNTARKIMIFDLLYMSASCILYGMNTASNKVKAQSLKDFHGGEMQELGNADQIIKNYTPCILVQMLLLVSYRFAPKN